MGVKGNVSSKGKGCLVKRLCLKLKTKNSVVKGDKRFLFTLLGTTGRGRRDGPRVGVGS